MGTLAMRWAILLLCLNLACACVDPRSFGAVEGNPGGSPGSHWTQNTAAIQKAISWTGSHCVEIQGGGYVTADLLIDRSDFVFKISEGSRLLLAVNETRNSVRTVRNASNVTITGGGTVYGNAEYYISYYEPTYDR